MKKLIIITLITIIILVITYFNLALIFLWLAVTVLCIVFLFLIGLIKLIKRDLRSGWYKIPFIIMISSLICVTPTFFKPKKAALPETEIPISQEIEYIVDTDQNDRFMLGMMFFWTSGGQNSLKYRDSIRLTRIMKIISDSTKLNPQDEYYAALVLQHGTDTEHYKLANKLSTHAATFNIESAEWLSHASWDRWQMSIGKPQKYGTQYKFN